MTEELDKAYSPKSVESHWYTEWEKAGYFNGKKGPESYTIVIPPPNVTGSLHMGHALNSTLQDILIRYQRMNGKSALWIPGTDHGGIATQNVVEKLLKKEKKSRHDMGREKFVETMWEWRAKTGDTILSQLKRLGASLDWNRTRFTMDDVCSKAVREAFVRLFKKGLLYRGKRLVNWCPRCHTALADIEVEHVDKKGHLWHIRYPLDEQNSKKSALSRKGYLIVATTRPETMLGDTAVAVNPKDERFAGFGDIKIKLPLTNREIPIIADQAVDLSFGSGAVKVTPAHDQTDFEIGERHSLPHITVIDFEGKMSKQAGPDYAGLDRFDARKKIVEDLTAKDLIEKIEDYKLSISVCYRCGDVIEPLESEQWFLSTAEMADRAREATKSGQVQIVPKSWESPYQLWLENLRDWCVSRQIWWGHRIPVWYCLKEVNGKKKRSDCKPIVELADPEKCPCGNQDIEQDSDVLDTWFSSALWPFSVFGWPEKSDDLTKYYPTSTLVTGHEILYLWVARMVMFGLEFLDQIPFDTVFIHGIVRDKQGRKMSKSLGNVVDPLELIDLYGADAVRFSLAQSAAPGRDMQIANDSFIGARNFSNKIWNATRFALMHLQDFKEIPPLDENLKNYDLTDRWIMHEYNNLIESVNQSMARFDMDSAAREIYEFFWSKFCDWYLEMIKPRLDENLAKEFKISDVSRKNGKVVLATILEGCLRLLHPFMPFISEELWQKVPKPKREKSQHLMNADWPLVNKNYLDSESAQQLEIFKEIVSKLRSIRSEMGIPVTQKIEVIAKPAEPVIEALIRDNIPILKSLNTRVLDLKIDANYPRPKATATAVVPGADLYVPLKGLIDFSKEKTRLEKELTQVKTDADRLLIKLSNQDFVAHAPESEIAKTKDRLQISQDRTKRLIESIEVLTN